MFDDLPCSFIGDGRDVGHEFPLFLPSAGGPQLSNLQHCNDLLSLMLLRPISLLELTLARNRRREGGVIVNPDFQSAPGLNGGGEVAVHGDVAVGHARRVERKAGVAVAVEQDEAAGGVRALAKDVNGFARGEIGGREVADIGCRSGINASHP